MENAIEAFNKEEYHEETKEGFPEVRRERSLSQLCVQFVHLFATKLPVLSLEQAAKTLADPASLDYNKIKTKIRRLYDIANVLQSLNLIEKTLLSDHKPGFKWLGQMGYQSFVENQKKKFNPSNSSSSSQASSNSQVFNISQTINIDRSEKNQLKAKYFKPKVLQIGRASCRERVYVLL